MAKVGDSTSGVTFSNCTPSALDARANSVCGKNADRQVTDLNSAKAVGHRNDTRVKEADRLLSS